ncbi:PREDICTED: zinc finger FYVE domain-containing protein 16-like [Cyprinodon variegatus]|nr:PREDICTED: zinc finger FYVE domain-containing protein 16-like [Cyprinodon variegatus]
MDSFFKAAVCDLDKVLDDFELNSEEAECQPVFLKPPAYPFCPDVPSGPTSLPDLNSLHYGSAGSCSDASNGQQTADGGEVRGQPLTAVDLLSSVDRRPAKNAAPPCPDRTLKPVCDLVNDASSAILVRTNSQEEEALLVDFDSPAVTEVGVGLNINSVEEEQTELSCHQQSGGYSASLSLLDIIFPAAAEKSSEPSDQSESADADEKESEEQLEGASSDRHKAESDNEVTSLSEEQPSDQAAEGESDEGIECESSNGEPGSLSCLPLAVSMCGALVNSTTSEDPPGAAEASESTGGTDDGRDGSSDSEQMSERRPSPEGQHASLGSAPAEPDPPYAPEFGFEYLPESDQAELLVTDEELDAFLQAHAEAEQGAGPSLCSRGSGDEPQCLSESGQVLEERRDEPEPGSCGQEQEEPEALSSGDGTSAASAEGSFSPSALSASGESIPSQCHDSYGGARPKQPHSQTARPPPAGEEGTEPSTSPTPEEQEHPAPTEDPSKFRDSDLSSPPYQQDFSAGFDELSEPPPYPGEEPLGAARPANWKGDGEEELGSIQPAWVPDAEAPSCMKCHQTFTFIKRRHHCRACGKVYCAGCCNRKCKLKYLDKEARVCVLCFDTIHKDLACKLAVPGAPEALGVTAAPGSAGSDPGGDEPSGSEAPGAAPVERAPVSGPWDYGLLSGIGSSVSRIPSLLPDNEDELPPLLITTGEDDGEDVLVEESPAPCQIRHLLEEGGPRPLTFVLNANLLINVKLVTYGSRQCWCFGSNGLQALGQKELIFLLECLSGEKTLPRDLFSLYLTIYQDAQKGKFVEELDNVTFTSSFLDSKDHAGMLFFAPTCQPLDGLTLPPQPFLFGLLVQKLEVPWAKVFPLRLLLRLGAEYDMYPTTLISVRFRESVYRETGHTIMNLLADLRNYQYSLSVVEGLRIHMEMGHSYIEIPKASFSEMQKVVNSSNEHVISIGASFSQEADSHLVCFQNEEGNYQTQANSKPGETRTVTGASFVVFNGALKASSGFIAKSSIVEDGLMVQIPPETMESLRSALREQTDFDIPCGKNDGGEVKENVTVRWVDWSSPVNSGKTSGVDGRPLDGVPSVRMEQDTEFESHSRTIRCTEVFYQLKSPDCSLAAVLSSCSGFQKEIALATCSALAPHLSVLTSSGINSLWLRVSTQADMVEYQAGSGGRLLPQRYMNEMDGALIPVIHGGGASVPQTAMDMELVFYITHSLQ